MAWGRKGRKDGYVSPFDSNDPDRYVNPGATGEGLSGSMPSQSAAGTAPGSHDATSGTPAPAFDGTSGTDSTPFPSDAAASADIPGGADVAGAFASPMPAPAYHQTAAPATGPAAPPDGQLGNPPASPVTSPGGPAAGSAIAYDVPSAPPQPSAYDAPSTPGFTSPVPVHAPAGGGTGTTSGFGYGAQGTPYAQSPGAFGPTQSGAPYGTDAPGTPTTPLERANAATRTKPNRHPAARITRIIGIIIVIIAVSLFGHLPTAFFHGIFGGGSSSSYSTSSDDTSTSGSDEPAPRWKAQQGEGTVPLNDDGPAIKVSIDKMETGPADNDGKPTVLVTYTWTNSASEDKSFTRLVDSAYQDGIGLEPARSYDNPPEGYDRNAANANVQPNASQTLKRAYRLADPAKDVVVTVSGPSRGSDIVADTFAHGSDGSYTSKGEVPESIKNGGEAPTYMDYTIDGVPKEGIKDADGYSGKLLGIGGVVTQMSIDSAAFLPGAGIDSANKDIVAITYRWRNDGERPWRFSDAVQDAVYQNGVECDPTSPSDLGTIPGYSYWMEDLQILPGATYSTVVVYKVDPSKPVDVQVKGYVNSDSVKLERTFTQGVAGTTGTAGGSGSQGGADAGAQDPTVE